MSRITVIDNTLNQKLPLQKFHHDCENLRKIANKTIADLQTESGILIYPPRVSETNDKINDSVIFNLKEDKETFSLDTGNIMGFIGRKDTELNICSRFTHRDEHGKLLEKNDFFLHYLLEKVCHINLTNLQSTRTPDSILNFLPFLFPQYLLDALRQGLYKEYQTRKYNNSNVKGIIDISRHIRFNIPENGKIAYNTREYSYDNPVTELVRHTIEYMRTSNIFKYALKTISSLDKFSIKDVLGFTNWLILGNFVQKLVAEKMDKSLIKRNGQGVLSWLKNSSLMTRDEVLHKYLGKDAFKSNGTAKTFKEMLEAVANNKAAKKQLRTLTIAQLAGYAYSGLVLGLGIPNLNKYLTNRRMAKAEAKKALENQNNMAKVSSENATKDDESMFTPTNIKFLNQFTGENSYFKKIAG